MASGDTVLEFLPANASPGSTAAFNTRNSHLILAFDPTTTEQAIFAAVMPRNYSNNGITVYVHYVSPDTSGTIGWLVAFERIGDGQQDIDSDGFGSDQTITAVTVPGTSGHVDIVSVAVSHSDLESIVAGEGFRLRIKRDVANDNAASDAQLWAIELKET